jgi:hypothetical protein
LQAFSTMVSMTLSGGLGWFSDDCRLANAAPDQMPSP